MLTKFIEYLYLCIIHVSRKLEENPINNNKDIKNYVFTSITMFVDFKFRLGQSWVRRDGIDTPIPPPSTPYTHKLFKSNLNIVVNKSCKFHNCLNILTSLSMYLIAKRVRLPWSVLVSRESVVTGSAPHTPSPSTPYTQRIFKSNLNIVVNISCKFHNYMNILTSLSMYLIAKRQVRLPWSVLVGRESVVTGLEPSTPLPSTPYTQKLFKWNLNIVVNISCKFHNSLKISTLLKIQSWRAVLICSRLTGGQAHTIWVMFKQRAFWGPLPFLPRVPPKMSKRKCLRP